EKYFFDTLPTGQTVDVSTFIEGGTNMLFAPAVINLQTFKLNSIDHTAVLNIGQSQLLDIFVAYKRNQGIGEQNGDGVQIILPVSSVLDSDFIDSPSVKNSIV
ncbi:hypothetical protein, partial [Heyndrickxia sporothermodurans]